jgi:hypothetical protein
LEKFWRINPDIMVEIIVAVVLPTLSPIASTRLPD